MVVRAGNVFIVNTRRLRPIFVSWILARAVKLNNMWFYRLRTQMVWRHLEDQKIRDHVVGIFLPVGVPLGVHLKQAEEEHRGLGCDLECDSRPFQIVVLGM